MERQPEVMNILEAFKPVTSFVFDIDGVLTDGTVLVLENGVQARRMSVRDGYALQLAIKKGYRIKIISGANAPQLISRLTGLGITDVEMGIKDKAAAFNDFLQANRLKKEEVLFMGDDMPDLQVMKQAGLATCPADAIPEIRQISGYISPVKGGEGCVRDVIEKVMKMRGDWNEDPAVTSA
jgi:3-deoxy-D-manno-octulosonate 8-phosphate phosphatase (KDO 8-P phosphatase)